MTIEQSKKWGLGQSYWLEYVRLNGFSVEAKKDGLMDEVEKRLKQQVSESQLFTIKWQVR